MENKDEDYYYISSSDDEEEAKKNIKITDDTLLMPRTWHITSSSNEKCDLKQCIKELKDAEEYIEMFNKNIIYCKNNGQLKRVYYYQKLVKEYELKIEIIKTRIIKYRKIYEEYKKKNGK
jgi:hypothetical protein